MERTLNVDGARGRPQMHPGRGLSLTEMLVVLSIMVILMAVLIPALGAFTHTTRVIAAGCRYAREVYSARRALRP